MSGARFAELFAELSRPEGVSPELVRRVFDAILAGEWTPTQVAGMLVGLRLRGESAEIIAAAAESLRSAMRSVDHGLDVVLDTCGTGGDGHGTLNLSTGAAIVAAAAGVPVAKHGNRAVSSRAGSADVLEALGIALDVPPEAAASVLHEANIVFLMAPVYHPAMRHAAVARRELGIRSIFNCLGPLANPARATHQLLGAYDDQVRTMLARTLQALGTRRAWVVRGRDGLDEVSPFGPTKVTEIDGHHLAEIEIAPEDFGMQPLEPGSIDGGDPAHNAAVLEKALDGGAHPAADAFALNAAAALVVARGTDPKRALDRAREVLANGAARRTLESWRSAAAARRSAE